MIEPRSAERSHWLMIGVAVAATVPAIAFRVGELLGADPDAMIEVKTVSFGVAILGAAFLLSWGAEVAQLDISQGLAIAFMAFIAVLPEYAVDLVFAWKAGAQDAAARVAGTLDPCVIDEACSRQLAIANMTGANRLLIGVGWAVVVLVWWRKSGDEGIVLPSERRIDLGFLFVATLWAIGIVIRQSATILDSLVLVGLFVWYVWHASKEPEKHLDLIGPPVSIAALGVAGRRAVTVALFAFSAAVIIASAEPFAEGLVRSGERLGIDGFLLVQWVAPLASEAPEMLIAILFVLRFKPTEGLSMLVSSKVNQWTLLVGALPLVYAISFGSLTQTFHLGGRQVAELFLTAALSLFAVAVLSSLTITRGEAIMLLVLFLAQVGFPSSTVRYGFAFAFIALFLGMAVRKTGRGQLIGSVRAALSRPGLNGPG